MKFYKKDLNVSLTDIKLNPRTAKNHSRSMKMSYENRWETVDVKVEEGIAWVTLNRPEKKKCHEPNTQS